MAKEFTSTDKGDRIKWYLDEDHSALKSLLQNDEWRQHAEIVKQQIKRRTTFRVTLPGNHETIYIKHDHPRSLRHRLKSVWRLKGKHEYEIAHALQTRGVTTVPVIGWGKRGTESFFITGVVPEALDFWEMWQRCRDDQNRRRRFLEELTKFVTSMTNAGVHHLDFHFGNILARIDETPVWFYLLDFSNIAMLHRLTTFQRKQLLAGLYNLLEGLSPTEQLSFFRAADLCEAMDEVDPVGKEIVSLVVKHSYLRWSGRRRKLVSPSSMCERHNTSQGKWLLRSKINLETATAVLGEYNKGASNKEQQAERLIHVESQSFIIKVFNGSKRNTEQSGDEKFWLKKNRLSLYGIQILEAVAWFRAGDDRRIIVIESPDIVPLYEQLEQVEQTQKRTLLYSLAKLIARLHNFMVWQENMRPDMFEVLAGSLENESHVILRESKGLKFEIFISRQKVTDDLFQILSPMPDAVSEIDKYRFVSYYRKATFTTKVECRQLTTFLKQPG